MNRKFVSRVILPILIIVELSFLFLTWMSYSNKDIDKIKEISKVDKEMFAMYVINETTGKYEEVTDSEYWPSGNYKLNTIKSSCVDTKGKSVSSDVLNYSGGKLTVSSNQTLFCYLYFDIKADITINVSTDGVENVLPTTGGYKNTLSCNDATYSWNPIYQRIEFSSVSSDEVKCNLDYTKDTETHTTLKSEVESKASDLGNATITQDNTTFTPTITLEQSSYTITTMETTSDNKDAFIWDDTAKTWTSQNHTSSTTSNGGKGMSFTLPNGAYQICYTMYSEKNFDYGTVYIDGVEKFNTKGKDTSEYCEFLGLLTSSNVIRIAYRKDGSGNTGDDNIVFYIKAGNYVEDIVTKTVGIGHRYTGKQPDNWIWFNGEKWRIIGSIPTTISDGTETKLVKIIRNGSIGGLVFDGADSNTTWGSNTLYTLLNSYYYGKGNSTGASLCLGYSYNGKSIYALCDYEEIGISNSSTDYYGRMIKDVYWNVGRVSSESTVISTAYITEEGTSSSVTGKIGLMSASDYGYATSGITYSSIGLSSLSSYEQNNWLYGQGYELTLTPCGTSGVLDVDRYGYVSSTGVTSGSAVRPVVYLDSSVYIISGDGTEGNPYQIGM